MGVRALLNATPVQIKETGTILGVPDFEVVEGFPVVRELIGAVGARESLRALLQGNAENARNLLRPYRRAIIPQRYRNTRCGACNLGDMLSFAGYCQVILQLLFRGFLFRVDLVRTPASGGECEVVFEEAG